MARSGRAAGAHSPHPGPGVRACAGALFHRTDPRQPGDAAIEAQDTYHRALLHFGRVEVNKGFFVLEGVWSPRFVKPPSKLDRVKIWKLEEKQTDVHLALQLYRDVIRQACEQVVIVSSDSDLEPALKLLKVDAPHIRRGVVFPRRDIERGRPPNALLSRHADWTRHAITDDELSCSQFPVRIARAGKPIVKPDYW